MSYLDDLLKQVRTPGAHVTERVPAVETESYYRMICIESPSQPAKQEYPLTKYEYSQYTSRTEGDRKQ